MNILQINTMDSKGGAAKIVGALDSHLREKGHASNLFVKLKFSDKPNVFTTNWPNPVFRIAQKITGKDIGSIVHNKIRPLLANDVDFFKTDNILKTEAFKNADVVHCHNLHGNYFKLDTLRKMAEQKPVIWTLHDTWAITPHCARLYNETRTNDGFFACDDLTEYPALSWDNRESLKRQKMRVYNQLQNIHIVTPSHWLKEKVGRSVLGEKKTSVIWNGIDTTVFKKREKEKIRRELKLPLSKKIILFMAARLDKGKGSDHIKEVCQRYEKDRSIIFISIGAHSGTWNPPNVTFVDYISDEETVARYFSAADIFLYPSLAESFGLVAAEALATGTPVVTFNSGGLPEIVIHKENGYVARWNDTGDLINGIHFVLGLSPQELRKMARESRSRAETNFDTNVMVNQYVDLYAKITKQNS
jgi:protein O-GlcNAc transferase